MGAKVEAGWARYSIAVENLEDFEAKHPKLMVVLRTLVEEFNKAVVEMDKSLREEVTGRERVGPFSTSSRTNTALDIPTILLKMPKLLLEPGVVSRVNPKNTIKACEMSGLKDFLPEIATVSKSLAVSKPEEMKLEWPREK